MSSEENYLDNLLNSVQSPETVEPMEKVHSGEDILGEPLMGGLSIDSLEMPEAPDLEIPDLEIPDLDFSDLELPDIAMPEEESEPSVVEETFDGQQTGESATGISDAGDPGMFSSEVPNAVDLEEFSPEIPDVEDIDGSVTETSDVGNLEEFSPEISDVGDLGGLSPEIPDVENIGDFSSEIPDAGDPGDLSPEIPDVGDTLGFAAEGMELPDQSGTEDELSLEDVAMPGSEDDFKLEDIEIPDEGLLPESELSIDGLDQAIQSETERQMAGELNIDELEFDSISAESGDFALSDDGAGEGDASITMDDNLEDVLNMLDDDAELAEINNMLKKSDNKEPIQDDMMNLLHQMADDEAASVNAGIKHADDDDDGVPLPEIPKSEDAEGEKKKKDTKKKEKKAAAKKKKKNEDVDAEKDAGGAKEPGKLGKFMNLLTEELVPEPTDEEIEAEREAKKQEKLTKKEEEKLAKEEAKKAKAEEKAAADKVKQEAAAQKKKEKQAKKEAKEAAKKAKQAAEGPKKRIPPKKMAVAAAFGVSVGGAIILATNILSTQGFLQTARNAYYDGDYKAVYEATYGMELDDSESDGLIKARSEVIFKVQQRYDSYRTNVLMGREVEALDALLRGITAYDAVNADAERYGVMSEVDAVKANILSTLEEKYGLDESEARAIISNEDALSYTIALNDVIAGN